MALLAGCAPSSGGLDETPATARVEIEPGEPAPPYSPELNAIERVWLYLRERFLSHRLWPSYDDILDACCAAWNALLDEAGRTRSLCSLDWAAPVKT